MNFESNKRMWDAHLAVHRWLTVDFAYKINHATQITDDDITPYYDARQMLKEEKFNMDSEVFRLSNKALVESLHPKFLGFTETVTRRIQAFAQKDESLARKLTEQMGLDYNAMVRDYEDRLHEIKEVLDKGLKSGPQILLPSLKHVGGGVMISSPNAKQESNIINAEAGSTVTAPAATHADHSSHIVSTVTNSPGAITNVAQTMSNVANHVTRQVEASSAGEDVKELMKQLVEQIASINVATNPEKVQEMVGDLKTLGDEMVKQQPRRKWYELSLQGIKEAAEAVGEAGKPIIASVMKLISLLVG